MYRSNFPGSRHNDTGGLVVDYKVNNLSEALEHYKQKKDEPTHAYGLCDSRGYVISYNARLTSSFEGNDGINNCLAAIQKAYPGALVNM